MLCGSLRDSSKTCRLDRTLRGRSMTESLSGVPRRHHREGVGAPKCSVEGFYDQREAWEDGRASGEECRL